MLNHNVAFGDWLAPTEVLRGAVLQVQRPVRFLIWDRPAAEGPTTALPTAGCVGRPYIWGLGAFGQPGVEKVLDILRTELLAIMQ